jgi:microcystin-dependent protein
MANPIAVPGTNVPSGAAVSPGGSQGPTTVSANANNKATLGTDSLLLVQGTAAGVAATTHAQTVSGDDPQLTNARTPTAHQASHVTGSDQIPLASVSTKGLLNQTSGNTTDFIDGTNNSQPIVNLIPPGTVWETARSTAPTGWLLCDGASYTTAGQPSLFAAIGYSFGGSGANFNVPDCRGRSTIGVGTGSGLTARALAANGGEETHQLSVAELAIHNHTDSGHNHTQNAHTHIQNSHFHGIAIGGGAGANNILTYTPNTAAIDNSGTASYAVVATNQNTTATNVSASAVITNTGSNTPHNTMMPFIALNKIIKT